MGECLIEMRKVDSRKGGIKIKAYCKFCGCHFPQDFEDTLKAPCNFWGEHGLSNVAVEIKKEIWDWLFSAPIDKLNILHNLDMPITFNAVPVGKGMKFEDFVVNWSALNEEERQEFQRDWFRDRQMGLPMPQLPIHYGGK